MILFLGENFPFPIRENMKNAGPGFVVHACYPSIRVMKGRKIRRQRSSLTTMKHLLSY